MNPANSTPRAARWRAFFTGILLSAFAALTVGWYFAASGAGQAVAAKPAIKRAAPTAPAGRQIALLSGGCFWSEQAMLQQLKGVDKVVPGYAGGWVDKPTYERVCTETTGFAETVAVTFDPTVLSYHDLLTIFMTTHNPTTLNQQGGDVGTSYRSAVWYLNADQKATAEKVFHEVNASKVWPDPIVTELKPYSSFYTAEAYHFDYYNHHPDEPYCQGVIAPKIAHLHELYRARLKANAG